MAPVAIRDLRRVLRYRNLVVREATRMKNRIAGLLMETGTPYNKQRLHGKAYFSASKGERLQRPALGQALMRGVGRRLKIRSSRIDVVWANAKYD
jgi:hypothetical protein